MKTFIKKVISRQTGVMLMEMLLVMPLYMFVFGGIYYLGESVLMNNRVLEVGCAKGYVALHYTAATAFKEAMRNFLDKDGSLRKEGAQMEALAYFTENDTLVTNTSWAAIVNSYATLTGSQRNTDSQQNTGIPLPAGIEDMMKMGDDLYNPDAPPDNTDYTMSFGLRQVNETSLRHWLVARKPNAEALYLRPSMGNIVISSTHVQGGNGNNRYEESNCKYYTQSVNYNYHAIAVMTDNWILAQPSGEQAPRQDEWESYFYPRAYGTFFSNH